MAVLLSASLFVCLLIEFYVSQLIFTVCRKWEDKKYWSHKVIITAISTVKYSAAALCLIVLLKYHTAN